MFIPSGLLLLLLLSCSVFVLPSHAATELQPSVLLLGTFDYEMRPGGTSRCIDMVNRASTYGISRVNFVVTAYFQDPEHDGSVNSYCYMDSGMNCQAVHQGRINRFRECLTLCFARVDQLGLDISIVPHLDEGVRRNAAWRNSLVFDPLAKLSGWSYEEVLLNPVADALAAAMGPQRRVWLAMQGEMSATVLRFPGSYAALLPRLRQRVHAGRGSISRVKMGLSFNFNKLHDGDTTLVAQLEGPPDDAPAPTTLGQNDTLSGPFQDPADWPAPGQQPSGIVPSSLVDTAARYEPAGAKAEPACGEGECSVAAVDGSLQMRGLLDDSFSDPFSWLLSGFTRAAEVVGGGSSAWAPSPPPPSPPARDNGGWTPRSAASRPPTRNGGHRTSRSSWNAPPRSSGGWASWPGVATPPARAPPIMPSFWAPVQVPTFWAPPAKQTRGRVDVSAVKALLQSLDFIGISAYFMQPPGFGMNDLQASANMFFDEARHGLGLDLLDLMNKHHIELHYSEFGLGGGAADDGSRPATSAFQAGHAPFLGVFGAYKKNRDPWQNPQVRSYMHEFYDKTLRWLRQGGGPTYRVAAVFLWNLGSWDVLGVYPESTVIGQGTYRDPVVANMVYAHNKAVRAGGK